MALDKDKLIFDESFISDSDQVGAHLLGSASAKISSTNVSGKEGLDVNIINASIEVTATDLDIRDLDAAQDNVAISDGTDVLAINADGSINVGNTVTVQATDLDIRDLTQADEITVFQGTSPWIVSATDLDIRDLTHVSDSIKIGDGTDFLAINADGSINVNADISVVNGSDKAEDSAHASGDIGTYVLAVRQDALAADTSADGDYASLKVDALGQLYTVASISSAVADDAVDTENPIKVGSRAVDGLLPAISASGDKANLISDMYRRLFVNSAPNIGFNVAAATVTTTAAELAASPLAGRTKIVVQNLGNQAIFVGFDNTVTSANGLRISAGATLELEFGEDLNIWAIASNGSQSVRVVQLA